MVLSAIFVGLLINLLSSNDDLRGFLLTGKDEYLEPREHATKLILRKDVMDSIRDEHAAQVLKATLLTLFVTVFFTLLIGGVLALVGRRQLLGLSTPYEGILDAQSGVMDKIKILLVGDRAENLLALESLLKNPTVEFKRATCGLDALELLLRHEFALAILDVQMPEMDGFELAELMRGTDRTRVVPIIFVTAGVRHSTNTFRGYDKGAVAFLYKPLEPHIVKSKVQIFIDLALQKQLLQKKLEEAKRLLAERDDALQSRDEFLSIASHELKTPLTSLHLQLQIMSRTLKKPDVTTETKLARLENGFVVCEKQSAKLAALLDELLDLTRIRLGKLQLSKERTDLVAISREVTERFRPETSARGLELKETDPIFGYWDPTRIDQVVTNLVSNAIKYGNGKPAEINLSTSDDGKMAKIEIRDQGIGIPMDMLDKIFLRFERAVESDSVSGLGLGLYITRQIVEAHGGQITVESKLNQGSTFRIELPVDAPV